MAPTSHMASLLLVCCALSAAWLPHLVTAMRGQPELQETCAVGTSTITLQEQFINDDDGSVVFCRGTTTVRMCEGDCISTSIPSIGSPTGYSKDCKCCRERRLEPKEVILTDCYDAAGNALRGRNYLVQVPEPDSCDCYECLL